MATEDMARQWAQIIVRAWTDENFKKRLLADANEALKEYGFKFDNIRVKVVEGGSEFVIPLSAPPELATMFLKLQDEVMVNLCCTMGQCRR